METKWPSSVTAAVIRLRIQCELIGDSVSNRPVLFPSPRCSPTKGNLKCKSSQFDLSLYPASHPPRSLLLDVVIP